MESFSRVEEQIAISNVNFHVHMIRKLFINIGVNGNIAQTIERISMRSESSVRYSWLLHACSPFVTLSKA